MLADCIIGGTKVFRIGLGMSKIGTVENHSKAHIEDRLSVLSKLSSLGKVFIDTSPIYGTGFSESVTGLAINQSREKFFIASKYYPRDNHKKSDLLESVRGSMARLGVSHLDLLQLHWPNPLANIHEILEDVNSLISDGLINGFGVCNFIQREIEDLVEGVPGLRVISNQIELHPGNLRELDTGIFDDSHITLAYGAILQGRVTYSKAQYQAISNYAANYNLKPVAVGIALLLTQERPVMPILKVSSSRHLDEILKVFNAELDINALSDLGSTFQNNLVYVNPERIELVGDGYRQPYLSLSEALINPLDLFPSPVSMASRILKYDLVLPIKVAKSPSGALTIDSYDPFDQIKKFWAWRIAHPGKDIPVNIFEVN